MQIGGWQIETVDTGLFGLDGGAMFGIVPRPLWERAAPPDDRNRIDLAMRLLLLRGHDRVVLVDTGIGDKFGEKETDIYKIDASSSSLDASLAACGVRRDDITDVILTHLHFDHAGGATKLVDGELAPAFANATYHVQKRNLEWGREPSDRDRGSYLRENFDPLADAGVLETLDGPCELFPGVWLDLMNGHTFAQQLVRVTDGARTLLHCGDLVPTAAHVPIPYVMGYDLQPLETVREKREVFEKALAEDWLLVLEHDPTTEAVRLESGKRGAQVRERVRLADA